MQHIQQSGVLYNLCFRPIASSHGAGCSASEINGGDAIRHNGNHLVRESDERNSQEIFWKMSDSNYQIFKCITAVR